MGLKQQIAIRLFQHYRKNQVRLHELNYLFWECTLRCNFSCLHCGSDCPHKTLIVLTGGEPLMRKDLEQCGMEFYRREFPWGMVTNGYGLTPERFNKLLNAGLRSLTISLDGLTPETHDWFRGKQGAWERAIKAIGISAKEIFRFAANFRTFNIISRGYFSAHVRLCGSIDKLTVFIYIRHGQQ